MILFLRLAGLTLATLGCIMGYYTVGKLRKSIRLLKRGALTMGHYKGDSIVEFVTTRGTALQFRDNSLRYTTRKHIGQEISILYDTERPGIANRASGRAIGFEPVLRFTSACALFVPGLLAVLGLNIVIDVLLFFGIFGVGGALAFLSDSYCAGVIKAKTNGMTASTSGSASE